MDVIRGRAEDGEVEQRTATFTGTVWGDPLLKTEGVVMNTVYFAPGARTYWHRHEGGQMLHVASGEGWVAPREGAAARVRAGDAVWAPPGEEHWHGAGQDTLMVHTAVSLGTTEWLEEVSPEDYDAVHAQLHAHTHVHAHDDGAGTPGSGGN
jgi:quercetin dioxygenase-like cupin family protein